MRETVGMRRFYDGVAHTSTSDAGLWAATSLKLDATFNKTLTAAGTYPYHCASHPTMHGVVKVPVIVAPASGTLSHWHLEVQVAPAQGRQHDSGLGLQSAESHRGQLSRAAGGSESSVAAART